MYPPLRHAVILAAAAGLLLASTGNASASTADYEGPTVTAGANTMYRVGTTLSDSSAYATLPATFGWRQFDDDGICDRSVDYFYRSEVGHTYPGIDYRATTYTFPWSDGSYAELSMWTYDCYGNGTYTGKSDQQAIVQQNAFSYSAGWKTQSCACWSLGGNIASTRVGATATFRFYGDSIALISVYGPGRGIADIYVDGRREKSINLSRPYTTNRVVAFQRQWGVASTHQIKVVARTQAKVEIDAAAYN